MNRFALITVQLISIFSIVGFLAAACQSKQVYEGSSAVARNDAAKPSAEMSVEWLKNKDGRIDLMIWLTSLSNTVIFVKQSSFHLEYGGQKTIALNVPAFIELQPGERRQQLLIFRMGKEKPASGIATLTIDPISEGVIEKPGVVLAPIKLKLPVKPSH